MSAKRRKCVRGYQCGSACISPKKACRKSLNEGQDPVADALVKTLQPKGFTERFEQHWGNAPDYLNSARTKLPQPRELFAPSDSSYQQAGGIYMHPAQLGNSREGSAWRHQYGHAIDFQLNQRFSSFDRLLETYELSSAEEYYRRFKQDPEFRKKVASDLDISAEGIPPATKASAESHANRLVASSQKYFSGSKAFDNATTEDKKRLLSMTPRLTESQLGELSEKQRKGSPDQVSAEYGLVMSQRSDSRTPLPETDLRRKLFDRISEPTDTDRATQFEPQLTKTAVLKLAERAFPELEREINDLVGSLTVNKLGAGHSTEYYRIKGKPVQNQEVFANLVSLAGTGDPLVTELLEFFTPKSYQTMKKRLESL